MLCMISSPFCNFGSKKKKNTIYLEESGYCSWWAQPYNGSS